MSSEETLPKTKSSTDNEIKEVNEEECCLAPNVHSHHPSAHKPELKITTSNQEAPEDAKSKERLSKAGTSDKRDSKSSKDSKDVKNCAKEIKEPVKHDSKEPVKVDAKQPTKTDTKEPVKIAVKEPAKTEAKEPASNVKESVKISAKEPSTKTDAKDSPKVASKEPAKTDIKEPAKVAAKEPAKADIKEPVKIITKEPAAKVCTKEPTAKIATKEPPTGTVDSSRPKAPSPKDESKMPASNAKRQDDKKKMDKKQELETKLDHINQEIAQKNTYSDVPDLAAKLEKFKQKFMIYDVDMTGHLNLNNVKIMMEKLGQAKTHLELKKMIAEVDTTKSGVITYMDFISMILGKQSSVLKKILMYEDLAKGADKPKGKDVPIKKSLEDFGVRKP
ncbi:unnamed protein product [Gordionus sp. m RMFG-2023]|uniref:proteoglycan 4-like n=1 Tax=Gordionus sp. m RMFG-2023 TaxID=3053472 RepID=UPI0030E0FF5E